MTSLHPCGTKGIDQKRIRYEMWEERQEQWP